MTLCKTVLNGRDSHTVHVMGALRVQQVIFITAEPKKRVKDALKEVKLLNKMCERKQIFLLVAKLRMLLLCEK